ncbi:MAG: hypothetical protein IT306_19125 [Chloroflexi bacterium]|nr:hypothetical protein [Chloroflexota bacterium]
MGAPVSDDAQHRDDLVESMSAQLADLYADRERLTNATGVATVDDVLALIASMQQQLESLYAERDDTLVAGSEGSAWA